MISNLAKSTHLLLNGFESCDLYSFKKRMEDLDLMATSHMGKLEWSNIDFDNRGAITNLVSNWKEPAL